ncbi:hypothetical protein H5410_014985 [Solanum commersonii]|uniref:Uncharacterized protein n=1 Tax=Solanum commersonii TaxID=4109 RepID=A0A9J5ZSH4_SOLCO|nr:hypothetical protein H5410_014985 [Solanum commersonii]
MGIDSTHLTTSEFEREEDAGFRTPIQTPAIEGNDEQIAIHEDSIYRDLPNLGVKIIQSEIQTSWTETTLAASSGSGTAEVITGTNAQIQTNAPRTDIQIDGVTA